MKKIIIGNLKNYMVSSEIVDYLKKINKIEDKNVIICPSNIYIPYFLKKGYLVGLQNINELDKTCTGEITPKQAKSLGINYTIVGHSERRINLKESDLDINKKIIEAQKYNMKIILCIGETLEQKNMLKTSQVLKKQLLNCLKDTNLKNIIIAYEPVWAIGTNKIPSIKDISSTNSYIKEIVKQNFNSDIKVLYGGSVNSNNIKEIINVVDGVLIGKASTDAEDFLKIIEVVRN